MPTLHITVGAPSSGKSTWAKSQCLPIVSIDDVKKEMKDSGENYNNEKIFSTARERVCAILTNNKDVIYDSTNMGYRNRKAVISAARKLRGIDVKIVAHVFIVPINVLYDRSIERNDQIHVDTIDDALSLFQPPCKWERIDEVIYHRAEAEETLSELLVKQEDVFFNARASELCVKRSLAEACMYLDVGRIKTNRGHAGRGAYMYLAAGGTPENAALIAYHELPEDMDAYDKMRKVMPIDFTYDLDLVHEADVRSRFV